LDLIISFDHLTGRFNFTLYTKPTNTFSYLLPNSNHPSFIFKNIPKSLFIRLRRICSSYIDFLSCSRILCIQLFKRNYNPNSIIKTCNQISKIDRNKLIEYKVKNKLLIDNNNNNKNLYFCTTFDMNNSLSKTSIYNSFKDVFSDNTLIIKPIFKMNTNLLSILIYN